MISKPEQRVLICTPFGKDAQLTVAVLEGAGLSCFVCKDLAEMVRELDQGVGAVLTTEEVLHTPASALFRAFIARQPSWSDLPVMVLTVPGSDSPWIKHAFEQFGNLTLLERPLRAATLISAARSTLRARQRQYEVRKADQRKDEFLAMLGHELRNPLAPIGAAAQLLGLVSSDPEKVKQSSEIITRQVSHMTSLIDDLLDVARVTRGLIKLEKSPIDMRHVLAEATEQVSPSICARQHHLSLQVPPQTAMVYGDYKRLVQIVSNVLTNACKYTREGGNIAIRLQVLDHEVLLEIADDGIGMEPDTVLRVFELFAQAERTSDRSQGGLGLGLSIVQSLVASHGGSVQASSEGLGRGSMFVIRLPRMADAARAVAASANLPAPTAAALPLVRAMVVDDNTDAANTLGMLLEAMGFHPSVQYTATSAIAAAETFLPHVCLLDIGLPDIDGIELAKRLRTMPEMAATVLIAVTGYGQETDRKQALAAGFDHHLVKPLDAKKLAFILAKIGVC